MTLGSNLIVSGGRGVGHPTSGDEFHHYYRQDLAPTASDPLEVGDLWSDTTANLLKRCTSISPITFTSVEGAVSFGVPTGDVDIGDAAAEGVSGDATRADHEHAHPAPGAGYPVDVIDTEADGSATTPARSDHVHAVGAAAITGQTDLTDVAGTDEILLSDDGVLKKIDAADVVVAIPYSIPIILEVPEGTNAFPDVRALSTTTAKKLTGAVLINGAGVVSTYNWKLAGPIPDTLPSSPVYTVRTSIMTRGAVAGPADLRLTIRSLAFADGEDMDVGLTAETEQTVTMPTADNTLDVWDQTLSITIAAGDYIFGQIERDSDDAADDFTDDVQPFNMCLIITGA